MSEWPLSEGDRNQTKNFIASIVVPRDSNKTASVWDRSLRILNSIYWKERKKKKKNNKKQKQKQVLDIIVLSTK